jgi:hypothetical protein
VRDSVDDLVVALSREQLLHELDRRERDLPSLDAHEQIGKPPREPRRSETPARLAIGHTELANTKLEHRRTCRLEMEATLFDLAEMSEKAREHDAPLATDRHQTIEELSIGEIGELHAHALTTRNFGPLRAR